MQTQQTTPALAVANDALLFGVWVSARERWLRGEELAWGKELEAEGKVTLCCDGKAATSLPNDLGQPPLGGVAGETNQTKTQPPPAVG